jgi:Spy/CpxP family protein refolding chaperone
MPGMMPPGNNPEGHREFSHSRSDAHSANNQARSSVQFGPVGRWWDNKSVVRSIGLSRDQQQRMDSIFDANKPAILSSYKTFLQEQSKLQALNKKKDVDQQQLFAAIDSVNQARATLQKATAQMLLQIKQQMAPEQVEKLEKIP